VKKLSRPISRMGGRTRFCCAGCATAVHCERKRKGRRQVGAGRFLGGHERPRKKRPITYASAYRRRGRKERDASHIIATRVPAMVFGIFSASDVNCKGPSEPR